MTKKLAKIAAFALFFSNANALLGQNYVTKKTATGKAKSAYDAGMKLNFANQNEKALKEFTDALKAEPTFIDAQIQQGAMFYELNRLAEAEAAFEKVLSIDKNYDPKVYYVLANVELKSEKLEEAAEHYEAYTQSGKTNPELVAKADRAAKNARFVAYALKNPVPFKPQTLGEKINTPQYSEYLPAFTADAETLVYTVLVDRQEDFFLAKKVDSVWQKGEPITELNTEDNEGAQCISTDGSFLLYTVCNREGVMGTCDVFFSKKINEKWQPARNFAPISSDRWDSQPSMSADGRRVYFASDRAGGLGGIDIWYIQFENGKWSEARNVGAPINTKYDDQTPFIHPDGVTLYFTSEGHPGMGAKDLYMVRQKQDGTWGEPQNLGYPINTKGSEGTLAVGLDGKTAYFARNLASEGQKQNYDLFSFDLPEAVRALPVTYAKAIVRDADTKTPLSTRLEFVDLATQKPVLTTTTDESGAFLVCLPLGKNYALNVSKDGYIFQSENFNLTERRAQDSPFLMEINLLPVKSAAPPPVASANNTPPPANRTIVLKNVFFDTDKDLLRPESFVELNKLKLLLSENPSMRIELRGHTDNVGDDNSNLDLSTRRALAVKEFLIKNGINKDRLQSKGFGESRPIDTNDTPTGRQNNRRTELYILN